MIPSRSGAAARVVGLVALYTAAAVVFTWPLAARFDTHIWGDRFDAWTTLWLIWHLATAPWAAHTDRINFPDGYNLWSFGHLLLQAIGAGLVRAGLSLVAAYNSLAIGALVTSALGAHVLGVRVACAGGRVRPDVWTRTAAGVLSATVFTFNPYLYGELRAGCLELVAAGLLPLFLAALLDVAERPGPRPAALAGLILAITGPFNWYYAVFGGMAGVAFGLWQGLTGRPRVALWTGAALALSLALVAPLLPMVSAETPSRSPIAAEQFSAERWSRSRALSDGQIGLEDLKDQDMLDQDAWQVVLNATPLENLLRMDFSDNPLESTPGRLAWAVGLVGIAAAGRRGLPWLGLALAFSVLTLGPYALPDRSLPIPAWSLQHPLPYYFLYNIVPFFAKAYRPYRLAVLVLMFLAAGAAAGAARLSGASRGASRALAVAAALLLGVGAAQPLWLIQAAEGVRDTRSPAGYLAVAGRAGALIEVPLHAQPVSVAASLSQYHQVAHGRPVLNSNQLIRRTELSAFRARVVDNGLLGALVDLGRRPGPWSWTSEDLAALQGQGFTDLVLHTRVVAESDPLAGYQDAADRMGLAGLRMLEDSFGPPWLNTGGLMAFSLRPVDVVQPGGTWRADRVRALPVPFVEAGLPVELRAGQSLFLGAGEGPARRLGLWLRAETGNFALRLSRGVGVQHVEDQPMETGWLPEGPAWVWIRLNLGAAEDTRPWSVSLVGEGRAWLARPELESW